MNKTSTGEIVPADPSMFARGAELLSDAFMNDHLFATVLPDLARRRRALRWMHGRVLRYCQLYGESWTTPDTEGVACWLPPGNTHVGMGRIFRTGLAAMPVMFGPMGYFRFDAYMSFAGKLRDRHAPEKYWYLWVLGVDPERQGKGIGGRLMEPVLDKADAAGRSCYLETEDEKNLRFYERHGFRVVAQGTVSTLGVTTYSMLRKPV